MADNRLPFAAVAFGVLALAAGGLQLWAYVDSGQLRHAVLAAFALSIGLCVVVAGGRALR